MILILREDLSFFHTSFVKALIRTSLSSLGYFFQLNMWIIRLEDACWSSYRQHVIHNTTIHQLKNPPLPRPRHYLGWNLNQGALQLNNLNMNCYNIGIENSGMVTWRHLVCNGVAFSRKEGCCYCNFWIIYFICSCIGIFITRISRLAWIGIKEWKKPGNATEAKLSRPWATL